MNAPTDLARLIPTLEGKVSAEEWQTRMDLAAAYRLVAMFKWDDLVFTHITAHIPGTEHYLINPYGLMFEEMTASSMVKIDLKGNVHQDTPFSINPAGFTIHSAVHGARHDIQCVVHTHTLNGVAVSAQKRGVLPISQQSIFVLASLAYHDYEGVALRDDEKPRLVANLGDKTYLMLRNHGLLTVGRSIAEAFLAMYMFETTCQIQLAAQAGGPLTTVQPQILAGVAESMRVQTGNQGGAFVWPALLRKVERLDPGYRT